MMKKRKTIAILTVLICVFLAGCGSNPSVVSDDYKEQLEEMKAGNYTISYESAEDFEKALNNDEDVLGKVVSFSVREVHPDSTLGYDLWAGEHLNFVGDEGKEAKEGDVLIVAVNSTNKKMGSWVIGYDLLDLQKTESADVDDAPSEETNKTEGTTEVAQDNNKSDSADSSSKDKADTSTESDKTEENSSLTDGIKALGYSDSQVKAIAEILTNVGIPEVDDMWNINKNGTLQANACTYKDHQINFTTDNGECFYVQITGWKEEISSYGWYRSSWSGKLKYGYNTQTKINTVDLYATDYDNSGYLAVYDAETDSVHPYGE